MAKPSFVNLLTQYEMLLNTSGSSPCDGPWDNQCAIRMSIVLNGEGTLRVNRGTYTEPVCSHQHARGAESLANWLWRKIGAPARYKSNLARVKTNIAGKQGIIFFKDCFTRKDQTAARGDHIDLWSHGLTMTYSDPSNRAKELWFWDL